MPYRVLWALYKTRKIICVFLMHSKSIVSPNLYSITQAQCSGTMVWTGNTTYWPLKYDRVRVYLQPDFDEFLGEILVMQGLKRWNLNVARCAHAAGLLRGERHSYLLHYTYKLVLQPYRKHCQIYTGVRVWFLSLRLHSSSSCNSHLCSIRWKKTRQALN